MTDLARELARVPLSLQMDESALSWKREDDGDTARKVMDAISSRMPVRLWRARHAADVRMGGQQNTKLLSA